MYLLSTLNEALVLRVTTDQRIWRMLRLNLLIADIGHLFSVAPLGAAIYYDVTRWNAMDLGEYSICLSWLDLADILNPAVQSLVSSQVQHLDHLLATTEMASTDQNTIRDQVLSLDDLSFFLGEANTDPSAVNVHHGKRTGAPSPSPLRR
ncbi:hypothetical protein TMatcc_004188 [Talaromyces marneffei ATCC 18224]